MLRTKPTALPSLCSHRELARAKERGVIMIITLIALAIMMIGGVALIRSFDTSMLMAGNLAFKRDLVNQGERGMATAITLLKSGALVSEVTRQNDSTGNNYWAAQLQSDAYGIPTVLHTGTGLGVTDVLDGSSGVTIRYVIDRQCVAAGAFNSDSCVVKAATAGDTGGGDKIKKPGSSTRPVYRISVRVTGPRNTQAYLQTTVTL